jgi:hypothetical protein
MSTAKVLTNGFFAGLTIIALSASASLAAPKSTSYTGGAHGGGAIAADKVSSTRNFPKLVKVGSHDGFVVQSEKTTPTAMQDAKPMKSEMKSEMKSQVKSQVKARQEVLPQTYVQESKIAQPWQDPYNRDLDYSR